MRKTFINLFITLTAFLFLGWAGSLESTYTRKATITNISGDTIYCTDTCGYLWEYYGNGTIGQYVTLIINDNHTSSITDDVIMEVK